MQIQEKQGQVHVGSGRGMQRAGADAIPDAKADKGANCLFVRRRADKGKVPLEKVSQKVRVGKQRLRSSDTRPNIRGRALPQDAREAQVRRRRRVRLAKTKEKVRKALRRSFRLIKQL